ncbi:MAG TPA: prolyl oligopeptidase family serine peptidase, partial [Acidimicrobiales bacterium]|nr:prolyl oligopeptidase family serine peptidase [Acidimicrobiales bacterium]
MGPEHHHHHRGQRPDEPGSHEGQGRAGSGPAFGWWPSPLSASAVAAGKVSRSGLQADGEWLYWSESRPDEGGRQVVVRCRPDGSPEDISPEGVSVRSRVHEYGGAAAVVRDGTLFYVDQSDQQWYRTGTEVTDGAAPSVLTRPDRTGGPNLRHADGHVTPSGAWLLSVEERIGGDGAGHRLVAVPVEGPPGVVSLADGRDFVAAPRPSPDGRWLAWITWDHPFMPWDRSELWVARLHESPESIRIHGAHCVAGGASSVGQPRWCADGSLLFVDDRSGWWNPYRWNPDGGGAEPAPPEHLVDLAAECHGPDWTLGQSTMVELADGSIACRVHRGGRDEVVRLVPTGSSGRPPWSIASLDQDCVSVAGLAATGPVGAGERLFVLGSTAAEAQVVFEVPWDVGGPGRRESAPVRGGRADGVGTPGRLSAIPPTALTPADVAVARPFVAETEDGPIPGLFYSPFGRLAAAPTEGCGDHPIGPPPLVVFCHGGPTAAADGGFDPVVQFFTSRGLAVAAVNYRGSSGFGRAFRQRLDGLWGEADVDDCVRYASALEEAGLVDGRRMAIRGTSAGGLTALGALIRSRRFAGAAAWYGVTDLEALAADTHDFESRYVDSLIGPWPAAADTYRARSPIHHADRVAGSVLLLQGSDDPVVPPDQSERFAALLSEQGVVCR